MTELPQPGTRAARQRESQPPTVAIGLFVGFVLSAAFIGLAAIVIPGVLLMVLAGFWYACVFRSAVLSLGEMAVSDRDEDGSRGIDWQRARFRPE